VCSVGLSVVLLAMAVNSAKTDEPIETPLRDRFVWGLWAQCAMYGVHKMG